MDGIGTTSVWGYSRALDLNACIERSKNSSTPKEFLVVGASDPRHVIKTVAHSGRYADSVGTLNFSILEPEIAALARNILLLDIIFGDIDVNDEERAELFLELYGNSMLREQTGVLLNERSTSYIQGITTDAMIKISHKIEVSADALKFRERDDLEAVFQFWRNAKQSKDFEMEKLLDARLRQYYGIRYDAREGVVDWDWNMKLKDKAPTISFPEFLSFRLHTMAFPIRQSTPSRGNRTLATITALPDKSTGTSIPKWGYFSDIVLGPFLAFGVDSENKSLLATKNDRQVSDAQDVSMWNLESFVKESRTGKSALITGGKAVIEEINDEESMSQSARVKIRLLTPSTLPKLNKSPSQFDCIFVGSTMAHRIPELSNQLKRNASSGSGMLIVETCKFVLDLRPDQMQEYNKKVIEMTVNAHLKQKQSSDTDPEFLYFTF
ncbi:hypothetical protein DFS34DRAFT_488806 [Phlyctochytrium arcticum]|nr:hypothetical protein DFS34DRAFT_488806 [Phlyctochytrium arcticum]